MLTASLNNKRKERKLLAWARHLPPAPDLWKNIKIEKRRKCVKY
jgi:hypothetical protein